MKDKINYDQHKIVRNQFKKGIITQVTPLWHIEQNNINFDLQGDKISPDLLSNGYTILNVKLENLIKSFDSGLPEMYLRKQLYNKKQSDEKISGVILKWLQGTPLIPPTILCRDSSLSFWNEDSDVLMPQDGKHRINVAYFFGAKTIPIIVMNKQLEKVKQILKLD